MQPYVDTSQRDSIINWVIHGLPAGGCTTCIIMDDYASAEARAHPLLKNDPRFTFQEMFDNLQTYIPGSLVGDREYKGLRSLSEDALALLEFDVAMCDVKSRVYKDAIRQERHVRQLMVGMKAMKAKHESDLDT